MRLAHASCRRFGDANGRPTPKWVKLHVKTTAIPDFVPPVNSNHPKYPNSRRFSRYPHRSKFEARTDGSATSNANKSRSPGTNPKCEGCFNILRLRGSRLHHQLPPTTRRLSAKRKNDSERPTALLENSKTSQTAVKSKPFSRQHPVFNPHHLHVSPNALRTVSSHCDQPFPS